MTDPQPELGPTTLQLAPVLDLNAAAPLAAEILLFRGRSLEIDASQVKRLGGQCLQVLLSAGLLWQADAMAFAILQPTDFFLADWRLFGAPELAGQSPFNALPETLS